MSGGIGESETLDQTENDILDQVQNITGDNFDEDDNDQETNNEEDDQEQEDQLQPQKRARNKDARETTQSRDDDGYKRIDREALRSRIPSQRRVDYDYDPKTRDVIDPRTGEVIFAGDSVAAEMFSQLQNEKYQLNKFRNEATQIVGNYRILEKELASYKAAPNVAKELGISNEQHVQALQYAGEYAKNPTGALKKMLTQAQADGVDLSEIFDGLPAIQRDGMLAQIKAELAPMLDAFKGRQEQDTQAQQVAERLNNEIQTFFGNNPDATPHADLLAHVITRASENGRQMSLNDAWTQVLRFANANRLDLNSDLREQLQPSQPEQRGDTRQARPTPPRSRQPSGLRDKRSAELSYDRPNRDFVREAMLEAGMDV